MQKQKALQILAGLNGQSEQQASAPTNVHIISGETGAASEDGKVPVRIDGLVYGPDDSQYVEMDTLGGLEEGETTSILLTGEPGHSMVPLAIGTPGGVDRAGKIAKDYLTEYTTTDDEKGLFVHRKTDDLGSENGVKIDEDVNIVRNGKSMAEYGEETRIGPEDAEHIILNTDGMDFRKSIYSIAKIARIDGGAQLSLGSTYISSGDSARVHAYSKDGWVHSGVQCSRARSGHGTPVATVEARATTDISQVYMSGYELTVSDEYGSDSGVYNVSMGNFGKLARCRIDIAFGSVTVPANGGLEVTLAFVNGGFEDKNYICSAMPMNFANGFNNVAWCVKDRAKSTVTIFGWNNNSYAVTYNIGVIGVDSRYGTVV